MESSYKYLLLGGGVASVNAVMGIREHDPEGTIALAGDEAHVPYDRPPLSKSFLANPERTLDDVSSKFDSFYPEHDVTLLPGHKAARIELGRQRVLFENGAVVGYDRLLVATGSRPKVLHVAGQEYTPVFPLRTLEDAMRLRDEAIAGRKAVIVGGGFIGMEVASVLCAKGLDITVLCQEAQPWGLFASPEVGGFVQREFEAKGVRFLPREVVAAITSSPEVVTQSGMRLPCDFVVMAAGVHLNVEFAMDSGLYGDHQTGLACDSLMLTSEPNVYAAGDVACFYDEVLSKHWHCEHHLNAKWTGFAAGANMAGARKPYDKVAYVWSDVFDLHMILRGDAEELRPSVKLGDVDSGEFVELHHDEIGVIKSGLAMSRDEPKLDPIADKLEELIRAQAKVDTVSAADFGL